MREVSAYEYNGKLYKTKEEALKQELYEGLTSLFSGCTAHDIMRKIVHNDTAQDELVNLIETYRLGREVTND